MTMAATRKSRTRTNRRPATTRNVPAATAPGPAGPIDKLLATWWAAPLLLLLLAILIYSGSLNNGFVLDDESQITGSESVHSLSAIGAYFAGSSMDTGGAGLGGIYYKPLMTLSYALIWAAAGPSGLAFHGFQLLLHVLIASLAFGLFRRFVGGRLALALSLVFLAHPINTECVVYAANLQDTLYMVFGLAALHLVGQKNRFAGWQGVATAALLLLAMLSKETGLAFLLVCGAYVYLFERDRSKPFAAAATSAVVGYVYLRFGVAHLSSLKADSAGIGRALLGTRLLTVPAVLWHYIATFVWPARLTVTQDWVVERPGLVDFWLPLLGLLGLLVVVVRYARAHRDAGFRFFALWAVAGFGLHSQLLPLDGTVADRWFYFTELGVLGMLGIVVRDLARRIEVAPPRWPVMAYAGPLALLVAVLAVRSHVRSRDWRDAATLYTHDLRELPDSFVLLNDYGVELVRADKIADSEPYFRRSTEAAPYWSINWSNLGWVQEQLGDRAGAKSSLERSMANGPYALAYENYARILAESGALDEARRFLMDEALPRFPGDPTLKEIAQVVATRAGERK
jgi:hypothetical protein